MSRVAVVGGGIAGLATATLLASDGHHVELFEQHDALGGRAGTIRDAGFTFDTGPSWLLMRGVFEHYADLLGASFDDLLDIRRLDPGYEVWSGPKQRDGAADDASSSIGRLRLPSGREAVLAAVRAHAPGDAAAMEKHLASAERALEISLDAFLYNPFSAKRSLLTRSVLAHAAELARWLGTDLSSWIDHRFRDPLLRQALQYPAIFLASDPRHAPAIYHLMSSLDLVEGVFYPMGGFSRFVEVLEALARESGVVIHTGARVDRILTERTSGPTPFSARGVAWRDATGHQHETLADIVVSAADMHHTETVLLDEPARSYPESSWTDMAPGPSAVLVMLGIEGRLPELPHHTLMFTEDWHEELDAVFSGTETPATTSLYVCRPSHTDPGVAPADHENLFVLVPVSGRVGLGHGTAYTADPATVDHRVEAIADAAVAQIARWADVTDLRERIVVRHTIGPADFGSRYQSWQDGMLGPAHTLRQSALFRRGPVSPRVAGLLYAGTTATPGVGVPMALISAELVLKLVRGDASPGPLPAHRFPKRNRTR